MRWWGWWFTACGFSLVVECQPQNLKGMLLSFGVLLFACMAFLIKTGFGRTNL
jgi:hypothetical protein